MKIYTYKSWRTKGIETIEVNQVNLRRNTASDGTRVYRHFCETYDEAKVKMRKLMAAQIANEQRRLDKLYKRAFELL